jgi:hypothetical protein
VSQPRENADFNADVKPRSRTATGSGKKRKAGADVGGPTLTATKDEEDDGKSAVGPVKRASKVSVVMRLMFGESD